MTGSIPDVREWRTCLSLLALAFVGMLFSSISAHAADLTGSATLTSDYVWRGTTQSQGRPAAQVGFRLANRSGFHGSAWGSNVEFGPDVRARRELDFAVGWAGNLSDHWALDVDILRYQYPSTIVDIDWNEIIGIVTYADNYWLSLGYSQHALGSNGRGLYAQVGAKFPVRGNLRIEAVAGRYVLEDAYGESYLHAQLSAILTVRAPFELRLSTHAIDAHADRIFGEANTGSRIEAAVQATF